MDLQPPTIKPRLVFDKKYMIGNWVAKQVGQDSSWGDFYAMGIARGDEVMAGVVLNNMNESNASAHIAVSKPSKLLPKLFGHFCEYAFVQCGLKRITGMVPTNEPKTIAFDKRLGFVEEFVMKDGANDSDMQVLVLWPHNSPRWLGD
jgi:hypothetical protein